MACSWDGTVSCIQFTSDEIGKPLSTGEKNSLYERMYGKSFQKNWKHSFSNTQIVENPEMLNMIEESVKEERVPTNSVQAAPPPRIDVPTPRLDTARTTPTPTMPTNKQIEVRLPDGKRRITPMFLTSVPSENK